MKEDIPTKFWRKYIRCDILKKEAYLKNIVHNIDELNRLKDEKLRKHALTISLMSYFDDLIETAQIEFSKPEKSTKNSLK